MSRSPSPCLSTSSSESSSSGEPKKGMNTSIHNHLMLPHHHHHLGSHFGSIYGSHSTANPTAHYSSLPFPIPALGTSFQMPLSLTKNSSLDQQFTNGVVVSTSGKTLCTCLSSKYRREIRCIVNLYYDFISFQLKAHYH